MCTCTHVCTIPITFIDLHYLMSLWCPTTSINWKVISVCSRAYSHCICCMRFSWHFPVFFPCHFSEASTEWDTAKRLFSRPTCISILKTYLYLYSQDLPYFYSQDLILRHGWNIRYGNNKNSRNKSNKEKKKNSNRNFQTYHGHLHTHWWRRVTW